MSEDTNNHFGIENKNLSSVRTYINNSEYSMKKIDPLKRVGFFDTFTKSVLRIKGKVKAMSGNFHHKISDRIKSVNNSGQIGFELMAKRRISRRQRGFDNRSGKNYSSKLYLLAKIAFFGVVFGILALVVAFPLVALDLPSPDKIVRREGFSTKIVDRNDKVLYDIYSEEKRIPVKFEDVPEYLKLATVSIEDKNFYGHQGFDPFGMIRGLSRAVTRGRAQGGSTLTQQLVKNVLLSSERSIIRKLKEFILAVQIERKYSKDEILLMYLNEAPYGGTAWGVEAASEAYFGKKVKDLNLVESAILAGFPQRPSYYSPYSANPEAYKSRTRDVLRRMREDGHINEEQESSALEMLENIEFVGKGANFEAPHFVQYVQSLLEQKYGVDIIERGGLKVTTTLDLDLHNEAQEIVAEEIEKVEDVHITNGAVVVIDPETGEILAMVGSKDFTADNYDGQVNVTLSLRQPGSAIKPITYVTALKENFTASTLLMDVPTEFPGGIGQPTYKPVNYDGKFKGPVQMRYALANSINIPAVKTLAMVGIKDTLETAYDLGLTTLQPNEDTLSRVGLSLTLGGGEVRLLDITGAYSAFVNKGYRIDPVAILKVEDNDGKILEKVEPKKGKRVLEASEAFIIADILSDNNARSAVFGTNSLLNVPGKNIAVKTGTTNDKRDNWTIGGNSNAVVGVWVGNNDNSAMLQVASGVSGASPIWRRVIIKTLEGKPNVDFEAPDDIVTAMVDTVSGYREHDGFPARMEYFKKGTVPAEDPVHVKLKVCKNDGRLATPSDVASGNYDEKEYFIFKEEDPTGGIEGVNKWQEGILAWIAIQNNQMYNPPTEYCGSGNPLNVQIVSPDDRASNLPGNFIFEVKASSTSKITEVKLEVDGAKLITFISPPYRQDVNLSTGVHELRAVVMDEKGNESDRKITIGVGVPWDYSPTPVPSPTLTPTPSPTPTP